MAKFYFTHNGVTEEVTKDAFLQFVETYDCRGIADAATFDGLGAVFYADKGLYEYWDESEEFWELQDMARIRSCHITDKVRIDFDEDELREYNVLSYTQYELTHEDDESIPEGKTMNIIEAYVAWDDKGVTVA